MSTQAVYDTLHSRITQRLSEIKGGSGSGNFGHAGRPGERGGSGEGGDGKGDGASLSSNESSGLTAARGIAESAPTFEQWRSARDWSKALEESLQNEGGDKLAGQDFEVRLIKVSDAKPTQQGEDYLNDSSKHTAKQLSEHKKGDLELDDLRRADFHPILINKSGTIIDGNHRHAAATVNKDSHILAFVPVGRGTGKITNLKEVYHSLRGEKKSLKGGSGSGNFGHGGRPGERGGSSSEGGERGEPRTPTQVLLDHAKEWIRYQSLGMKGADKEAAGKIADLSRHHFSMGDKHAEWLDKNSTDHPKRDLHANALTEHYRAAGRFNAVALALKNPKDFSGGFKESGLKYLKKELDKAEKAAEKGNNFSSRLGIKHTTPTTGFKKSLPPEYLKSTHTFASTQINIDTCSPDGSDVSKRILALARLITDDLLAEGGREETPHITLKYGLESDSPADVRRLLAHEHPINFTFGPVDVFEAEETGADEDVVMLRIYSPDLVRLNKLLTDKTENETTFTYNPHCTLAYVRAGEGSQFRNMANDITGLQLSADAIIFSDRDGNETKVVLGGVPAMARRINYEMLETNIRTRLAEMRAETKGGAGSGNFGHGGRPGERGGSSSDGDSGKEFDLGAQRAHDAIQQVRRDLTSLSSGVAGRRIKEEADLRGPLTRISSRISQFSSKYPAAEKVESQIDNLRHSLFSGKVTVKDAEEHLDTIRHGIFKLGIGDFKKSLKGGDISGDE